MKTLPIIDNNIIDSLCKSEKFPTRVEIDKQEENCKAIIIDDASDLPIAKHILANASDISKAIEERRKEVKEPYLLTCKNIDSFVRKIVFNLNKEIQGARNRITAFQNNNEVKRNFKKVWKYRVTDITKVPKLFLTVDDAMIKSVMSTYKSEINKSNTEIIKGIEFYTENVLVI